MSLRNYYPKVKFSDFFLQKPTLRLKFWKKSFYVYGVEREEEKRKELSKSFGSFLFDWVNYYNDVILEQKLVGCSDFETLVG